MSYLTEELLSEIRNEFPDISIEYREVHFGGIIPAFFMNIKDEEILANQWKAITEFIAVHFQSSLRNEFSLWNIYLFFTLEKEVRGDLKYTIENDTFSSRKIIIFPKKDLESTIKEHLKNDDTEIQSSISSEGKQFHPDPDIWRILDRVNSKKKITDDIKEGFDQIIHKIKAQKL